MNYYPFDSRNSLYRENIGALAEGETLRLKVLLHKDAKVHDVFAVLKNDDAENVTEIAMTAGNWFGDYQYFECETVLTEGLYWYYFRYTSDYGDFFISKTETSLGIVSNEIHSWQQTVYTKDFKTPEWLKGGIIYQIFPDRFYNSGKEKLNVPNDRFIVTDWSKQPEYRQNNGPCSLSNDYYGGDLKGIEEKLPYLESLGVTCIYLNPIFEAHSNHRYNTADYMKIDSLLGDEKDLESLVKTAEKHGIGIILDGVFSHTGDDSIYFNKKKRYNTLGAFQSKDSPYYSWYDFKDFPNKYEAWWGIETLPETNENVASYSDFITGKNGVLRYWLKKGIKGWRLDVADELPDEFLDKIRLAIKSENEENFLLGEVWEDATNKISYGCRRRFLRGKQLDSVMNYPFANAIVDFVKNGNSNTLLNTVLDILENYPPQTVSLLMNHIGTHDTARILTSLGTSETFDNNREAQSKSKLNYEQYQKAIKLLKLAAVLQYTLPGVPSVFYGDEAGLEGFGDPFCRSSYPWGNENTEILEFYKNLGKIRKNSPVFKDGKFIPLFAENHCFGFMRKTESQTLIVLVNSGENPFNIPVLKELSNVKKVFGEDINNSILPPFSYSIFSK